MRTEAGIPVKHVKYPIFGAIEKTKARRTAAGSIEQRKEKAYIARQAQKALIKSGMVWDQINKQWVPMSKG